MTCLRFRVESLSSGPRRNQVRQEIPSMSIAHLGVGGRAHALETSKHAIFNY